MIDRIRTSPSSRFAAACLAVVLGGAVHAFLEVPLLGAADLRWAAVSAVVSAVTMAAWRSKTAAVATLTGLAFAGFVRYEAALPSPSGSGEARSPEAAYVGRVVQAPKETPYGTQMVLESVPGQEALPGRLLVTSQDRFPVRLGDVASFRCRAEQVRQEPGPGYDDYLIVRGIGYRCSARFAPRIIGHAAPSPPAAAIAAMQRAVRRMADRLYPEPDASMLLGLLIGQTDGLTRDLKDAFRETGTSHILAVSGYNVTQLVALMTFVLAFFGLPRRRASIATAGIVVAFTVLAGAEASVVRAACMGCAGLAARLYRRKYGGVFALLAAAAGMVALNPLVLKHDAGFQLSFLAVMGLQAFGKPFERFFSWIPDVAGVRRMAAETSAATIATLPLTLYAFGMLPPTAFMVNLLVLPWIPVVMMLGAVSLLFAVAAPALGFLPALVVSFIIRAVLVVIRAAGTWQPAFEARFTPWALFGGYACIVALWVTLRRPRPAYLRDVARPV